MRTGRWLRLSDREMPARDKTKSAAAIASQTIPFFCFLLFFFFFASVSGFPVRRSGGPAISFVHVLVNLSEPETGDQLVQ